MSKHITPLHIQNMMETNVVVIKLYSKGRFKKKLLQKVVFSPKDLREYLEAFREVES